MSKITTSIPFPAGQKPAFDETPSGFPGIQSFKPNAAMQQQLLADMQRIYPGLVLVDGKMTLPSMMKKGR
jgi:hypothetical protein